MRLLNSIPKFLFGVVVPFPGVPFKGTIESIEFSNRVPFNDNRNY